jgi:hypothetical protein
MVVFGIHIKVRASTFLTCGLVEKVNITGKSKKLILLLVEKVNITSVKGTFMAGIKLLPLRWIHFVLCLATTVKVLSWRQR